MDSYGAADIESALVFYELVVKADVFGYPHDIKGRGIYAYVTLNNGTEPSETLRKELIDLARKEIGAIANLDIIQWPSSSPKTSFGKLCGEFY